MGTLRNELKKRVVDLVPERAYPALRGVRASVFYEPERVRTPHARDSVPETLSEEHVRDAEVVPSREEMLEAFPKGGRVAELGTDEGKFSEQILSITDPDELYLIDVWESNEYSDRSVEEVETRHADRIADGTVEILAERPDVALERFEDDSFDWVYVDTTHTYEQTLRELEVCRRKVKSDGVIAGHDYCLGDVPNGQWYGVIAAVHEFCTEYEMKLTYLSLETHGHSSFAIERIDP
ncbi:class I SAM-dependent methyltransferase [Halorubrum sp. CSM-61]|uniref:class I SAM-dependent methyltransferase n=1 Tax=Halorubrum sp. CSM-61 TaxID=2485838 RepID=UPI000F4CC62E|nr:class I SAM-dependent methyltransferase [Halorubrum sp. CSM-61]